jgi:menaquinone-dependent protoporphyrinogen oxidase
MTVLVVYVSKHGATRQIAERIAATLTAGGQPADAHPVENAGDVAGYDAFVIGAAAYYGHWLKPAAEFVRAHQALLAGRPVWLFSSGPLGTETTDAQGRDLREAALPKELRELHEATQARGHRVFFGALDPDDLTLPERTVRRLPAGRGLLPEGDFRDWNDIDAWADEIARELSGPPPADPEPDSHVPS